MIRKHGKKILATQIVLILLLSGGFILLPKVKFRNEVLKFERANVEAIERVAVNEYLDVQFICQAPLQSTQNWELHEESCEEAALLQAYNYEKNQTVTKQEANKIILDMIDWQEKNFGGHFDLKSEKMKEFISSYYELPEGAVVLTQNAKIEDIKKSITNNHPVIVPVTAKILKNPYYPYPGYHMLLVTGFTEDRIITNDNGTKHGEDFSYDIDSFRAAMEDAGSVIISLNLVDASKSSDL